MNRSKKSFALRISSDLFAELKTLADAELRSINGQIEMLLREAVKRHKASQIIDKKIGRKIS